MQQQAHRCWNSLKEKGQLILNIKRLNRENITFTIAADTKAYWFSFVRNSKVGLYESIFNILILSFDFHFQF